jgi:hypothetical protein
MTTICLLLFFAVWAEMLDYFSLNWTATLGDGWAVVRGAEQHSEFASLPGHVWLKHSKAEVLWQKRSLIQVLEFWSFAS